MQILWSHAAIKPNVLVVVRKSIRSIMKAFNMKEEHKNLALRNTDTLPMDEVCGAVHRVYDPCRFVGQDARLPLRYRLFSDETAAQKNRLTTMET